MSEVMSVLGSPEAVYKSGGWESWDYREACQDSITRRTVRSLEIWFADGKVDGIRARF